MKQQHESKEVTFLKRDLIEKQGIINDLKLQLEDLEARHKNLRDDYTILYRCFCSLAKSLDYSLNGY